MNTPRTWAALGLALALHAVLLTLPVMRPVTVPDSRTIELELTTFEPASEAGPLAVPTPPQPQSPRGPQQPLERLAEAAAPQPPAEREPQAPTAVQGQRRAASSEVILGRQYLSEEPVIDRIFGRPLEPALTPRADFRTPPGTSMLTLLNRPMQDLPFEYTPGLVHFAYAPGVRGDLQRFWDVITPEFGWRTKSGTEVRCVWLLVVAGCGWKHTPLTATARLRARAGVANMVVTDG